MIIGLKNCQKLKDWLAFSLNSPPPSSVNLTYASCFFYSQLSYIGAVLIPSADVVIEIQKIVTRFLFPNINIFPSNRIFLEKSKGGLGLPPIDQFIKSVRIKFASRAALSNQAWARLLRSYFPYNQISKICYSEIGNPLIRNYAEGLNSFHSCFYRKNTNFWSCPIFYNDIVRDPDLEQNSPFSPPMDLRAALMHKSLSDAYNFNNKDVYGFEEIKNRWDIDISFNFFFRMRMQ